MIFDEFPLDLAEGILLAHTLRLEDRTLRKGKRLTGNEIAALQAAHYTSVFGCRLDNGDIDENTAAARIAASLAGAHTHVARPGAGHCDLVADAAGLMRIDPAQVEALNLLDEDVLVATASPWQRVAPGDLVARVKIASFAIPDTRLQNCLSAIAARGDTISVAPFRRHRVGLILTRFGDGNAKRTEELRQGVSRRLSVLDNRVNVTLECRHDASAVAAAIRQACAAQCDLLVIGAASATVDRGDAIPAGICRSGGRIERFGFPLEPGSMLVLARHGEVPILVLPGCARSPKPNGLDGLLARLIAGAAPEAREVARWGCGGLLAGQRTTPEQDTPRRAGERPAPPRIAAVVLAAGRSQRMGTQNKLLSMVAGMPMVSHAVDAALAAPVAEVIVVTGFEHERISEALRSRSVALVHNPDFTSGLASSLRAGLAAIAADIDAAMILLGDMPLVTAAHLKRIVEAFAPEMGRSIIVPTYEGSRGNPILWSRRYFSEMMALEGDVGARRLLRQYPDQIFELALEDAAILTDVDTPKALRGVSTPTE